ncbi:polysaccharide deacetylase family protein [Cupriavidus metallidurans]|uniref:polysaccharide deacetylase family protein n=1 Tax=Cupriavidus metallidurans TaxID=119219 RepID=UPI001F3BAC24|nr:polysaccharide deacetylase family protein [Cupriavidus metallidurans]
MPSSVLIRRLTLAAIATVTVIAALVAPPALAEGTVTAADADQPAALTKAPDAAQALAPVRFLLTFDDGPDSGPDGSTPVILRQLANNPIAPGIKAVFFVQTAHRRRGGSPEGQAQMRDTCAAGHLLAVHSGLPEGHVPHTRLTPEKLADSLRSGEADIVAQCGHVAPVVRPPDWAHNDATEAVYHQLGLDMLMADANARDGKIYGWHISLRRRSHMVSELERVGRAMATHRLEPVDGVVPVIVAFHDTNDFTASHMTDYLQILVDAARENGLPLADPPFYTDTGAAEQAAVARAKAGLYARESWP